METLIDLTTPDFDTDAVNVAVLPTLEIFSPL